MQVLIATDAWHPQINGVVRTLEALAESVEALGSGVTFLTPRGFPSVPLPTYPGLRCALAKPSELAARIEQARPDAIHVATEGPIGFLVRRYCRARGLPFTTSFTTRFPEYIAARVPFPVAWGYAALRRFHAAAPATMVSTPSLMAELAGRGFTHLKLWSRGVDTELFRPDRAIGLDLPRPIFVSVGRIAPEKNLEAFLSLRLPGTKVVIGHGPQEAELRTRFPDAVFLGSMSGEQLAAARRRSRRVRVSEQDRHFRHRSARGPCQRCSRRSLSGDRPEGCHRRRPGGCAGQRPRACLPRCPRHVAGRVPRTRSAVFLASERQPVSEPCQSYWCPATVPATG